MYFISRLTIPFTAGFVCYDDGCHLKKFATHRDRRKLTPTATRLSSNITIVVDKMHFRGHTDKWCQENCNPFKHDGLHDVGIGHLQLN